MSCRSCREHPPHLATGPVPTHGRHPSCVACGTRFLHAPAARRRAARRTARSRGTPALRQRPARARQGARRPLRRAECPHPRFTSTGAGAGWQPGTPGETVRRPRGGGADCRPPGRPRRAGSGKKRAPPRTLFSCAVLVPCAGRELPSARSRPRKEGPETPRAVPAAVARRGPARTEGGRRSVCKHLFWLRCTELFWPQRRVAGGVCWCDSRPCSKVIWPHFDRVVPLAGVGGVGGSFEPSVDLRQRAPDRCVEGCRPGSTQVADRPVTAATGRERAMVRPALGHDGRAQHGCGRHPVGRPAAVVGSGQRRRFFWLCVNR